MKITGYPLTTSLSNESVAENPSEINAFALLETEDNETKIASLIGKNIQQPNVVDPNRANLIQKLAEISDRVEDHRNTFRGKCLGSTLTDEQRAAIADGSFRGLLLGDYWISGSYIFRIADFDYWYGKGGGLTKPTMQHHVVLIPDMTYAIYGGGLNGFGRTEGGYANCPMRTYLNGDFIWQAGMSIKQMFGEEYILVHDELLVNAVDDYGMGTGYAWYESKFEIPSEIMIYGNQTFSVPDGTYIPAPNTIDTTQLALFRLCPIMIYSTYAQRNLVSSPFWLRDIVDYQQFASAGSGAPWLPMGSMASSSMPIRPVFGVTGMPYPYAEEEENPGDESGKNYLPLNPSEWMAYNFDGTTLNASSFKGKVISHPGKIPIDWDEFYTITNFSDDAGNPDLGFTYCMTVYFYDQDGGYLGSALGSGATSISGLWNSNPKIVKIPEKTEKIAAKIYSTKSPTGDSTTPPTDDVSLSDLGTKIRFKIEKGAVEKPVWSPYPGENY